MRSIRVQDARSLLCIDMRTLVLISPWLRTPLWHIGDFHHENHPVDYWNYKSIFASHYKDVIMSTMASQITSLTILYSTVYSGANQRKHQSSASLPFVRGIHRWPVNSPHQRPVTRYFFPFDGVIMFSHFSKLRCCRWLESIFVQDMTRQGPYHPAYPIPWPWMTCRREEPSHQQP